MYLQDDDDSFAGYLALIRQSFSNADADDDADADLNRPVIGLVRKRRRRGDYELDVFGAEKYYSNSYCSTYAADHGDHEKKINSYCSTYAADHGDHEKKINNFDGINSWSSACSEYSRSTIKTPLALPATNRRRRSSSSSSSKKKKSLLALFRFYCSKENAVDVADAAARCLRYRGTK